MTFAVSNGVVTTLTFGYNASGCSGTTTVNASIPITPVSPDLSALTGGQAIFTHIVNSPESSALNVGGSFSSGTKAFGAVTYYCAGASVPGTSFPPAVSLNWTATKR